MACLPSTSCSQSVFIFGVWVGQMLPYCGSAHQAGRETGTSQALLPAAWVSDVYCVCACVRACVPSWLAQHGICLPVGSEVLHSMLVTGMLGHPVCTPVDFWCADPSSVLLAYCFSCCMLSHIRVHANAQECAGCGAVSRLGKLLALWGTDACGCACCEVLIQAWCCWCWGAASAFVVPCRCGSLPQSSKPPMLRQG
jgi:hypothetical protein